jgi:ABC-type multidrug transport system fused ATPase/permease subunit
MAAGDDRYLTARDRGPVRALARDVVDSRRNMGSIFMFVAILVLVTYALPSSIRSFAMTIVLVIFVMVAVDSFALGRRIRKAVAERYPEEPARGVAWYGIQRAMMIRRWRMPKARVKPGDPI